MKTAFKNKRHPRSTKIYSGFTLVEIMFAMAVTVMMTAGAFSSALMFMKVERSTNAMLDMERQVRYFREWLSRDVREAKVFKIDSSQELKMKLVDGTLITYQPDPQDAEKLIRVSGDSTVTLVHNLNSFSFSFNNGDNDEVLTSLSLSKKARNKKTLGRDYQTIFRKRN